MLNKKENSIQEVNKGNIDIPNTIDLIYVLDYYTNQLELNKTLFRCILNLYHFDTMINFIENVMVNYEKNNSNTLQLIVMADSIGLFSNFCSDVRTINNEIGKLSSNLEKIIIQSNEFVHNIPDANIKEKFISIRNAIQRLNQNIKIFKIIFTDLSIFEKTFVIDVNKMIPVLKQIVIHLNKLETKKIEKLKEL